MNTGLAVVMRILAQLNRTAERGATSAKSQRAGKRVGDILGPNCKYDIQHSASRRYLLQSFVSFFYPGSALRFG